jgi:hypothetical protein
MHIARLFTLSSVNKSADYFAPKLISFLKFQNHYSRYLAMHRAFGYVTTRFLRRNLAAATIRKSILFPLYKRFFFVFLCDNSNVIYREKKGNTLARKPLC